MRIRCLLLICLVGSFLTSTLLGEGTRLLRMPDVSGEQVVFSYASDLWIAGREGGAARRLTTFAGVESHPHFSPDGEWIAFSAEYEGNTDVYVVAAEGGRPRRLTWHPSSDQVRGWTPDGAHIYFASGRSSAPIPYPRFWRVSIEGGLPEPLSIPRIWEGDFSPDGTRMAYQMIQPWETEFRNYRGGQANPIRVIDLRSLEIEKLPWEGSNDQSPVWLGEKVYYLSDRDFVVNVWAYDLEKKELEQLTHFTDFDAKNLEAGGGSLIFEQGGWLHLLDPASGELKQMEIEARGDFPWTRPSWEDVSKLLRNPALSPSGKRAVFEGRGEILTVPAEKGDWRNLTSTAGVAERNPSWSSDGQKIAWFSDAGGEYHLIIADQKGENRQTIRFENPTFYYTPAWSPDSKHLSFTDADRNLWVLEVATEELTRIANEGFAHPERLIYPEWSPDSKWIVFTQRLKNQTAAHMVYSIESGQTHQITSGLSDRRAPAWDANGKYLYFLASTDYGLNVGWLDMSSYERPVTRAIYMAVLSAEEPSPLLPESDEEEPEEEEEADQEEGEEGEHDAEAEQGEEAGGENHGDEAGEDEEEAPAVEIDFEGLEHRLLALDLPERDYRYLLAGADGTLFYGEAIPNQDGLLLHRWTLKEREAKDFLKGVSEVVVSEDGKKLLYRKEQAWSIVDSTGSPPDSGKGKIDTGGLVVKVDPFEEWSQIFREAWRFQRDFFYVENVHGLDLDWAYRAYSPWVEDVRHRSDLNYVLDILGGETAVGHSFVGGGDYPDVDRVPVGLLGADLEADGERYRIARIFTGESWNPDVDAPLAGPGIDVSEGDYLLAVNGVELTTAVNPYSLFDRTAGRQTRIRLHSEPSLEGSREVVVVPVGNETALRRWAWVEGNRRKVDEMSDGKLAYIWLPNTGQGGYQYFNRYYFAQQDRRGAVIDERFNGGGSAADYMIDILARPLMGYFNNPVGDRQPFTNPNAGIWGPKVMIINDAAGSGGDLLPYMFRLREIGPLVGTKTWGGLVGIWDVPQLIDGGRITAPRGGYFNNEGEWDVENIGVPPDVAVEQEPKLVEEGRDPQLEKAVEIALELVEEKGIELKRQPPDPVRARRP